jgi:hypothetical protein
MRSRAGKILSAIIDSWSPPSPDPSSSSSVSSGTPTRSPATRLPKVPPYLEKALDKVALHWQQTIGQLCTQSETDPIDEFGLLILGLVKNNRLIFWKSFLGNSNMHSPGNTRSFALFQRYPFNLDLNEDLGDGIRPHYFVTIAIQIVRFLECSVAVGAPDSQGRSIWSYSCSPASSTDLKDILIAVSSTLHLRYPPNLISEILSDSSTWNFSRVCALLDRCVFLASFLSKYPYTITQQDIDAMAQLGQSEVVTAMHLFCPTSKQPRAVEYAVQTYATGFSFLRFLIDFLFYIGLGSATFPARCSWATSTRAGHESSLDRLEPALTEASLPLPEMRLRFAKFVRPGS